MATLIGQSHLQTAAPTNTKPAQASSLETIASVKNPSRPPQGDPFKAEADPPKARYPHALVKVCSSQALPSLQAKLQICIKSRINVLQRSQAIRSKSQAKIRVFMDLDNLQHVYSNYDCRTTKPSNPSAPGRAARLSPQGNGTPAYMAIPPLSSPQNGRSKQQSSGKHF